MKRALSHQQIRTLGYEIFSKLGVPRTIHKLVVDGLVDASLRGVDSHGIRLLPHYARGVIIGRINKNPHFSFRKTSPSTAIMDSDNGLGIAAGVEAINWAISTAKKSGIAAVAVKNSTHFGAAFIYSLRAAKKNMIGLSFTNTDSLVLPHGGKISYLGTNPICFAAPVADGEPFCLDMATSQVAWNKVLVYRKQNKMLDIGWTADENGNLNTDPHEAMYLLPFGGYKGYGLGLMVEILCSMLTGMPYGKHIIPMYPLAKEKRYISHFFLAINIAKFQRVSTFKHSLKTMLEELRSIPAAQGYDRVRVPDDIQQDYYKTRMKEGIPMTEEDLLNFKALAEELEINKKIIF